MTVDEVKRLADEYAASAPREAYMPGIFKTAQIALHAAIEALAAEQFEAGRQHERERVAGECARIAQSTWEGTGDGSEGDSGFDYYGENSAAAIRKAFGLTGQEIG